MEIWEKEYIKLKLAACFITILKQKKQLSIKNKNENVEDIHLIETLRQLEADSGTSFTLIQSLFAGGRDAQFTSIINLLKSLKTSLTEFASLYDQLTDTEIEETKRAIEEGKRNQVKKGKKKTK